MHTFDIYNVQIGEEVEVIPDYLVYGSKITQVTVPNSVTTIGTSAFNGCSRLTSATLGSGVTNIGKSLFYGCDQMTELTSLAFMPPGFSDTDFGLFKEMDDYARVTLHVPAISVNAYQTAVIWSNFSQIIGDAPGDIPGDVNGDGEVNIADVNMVIDVIINGGSHGHSHAPSNESETGSEDWSDIIDVNGDGEINIADANVIIDYILSR